MVLHLIFYITRLYSSPLILSPFNVIFSLLSLFSTLPFSSFLQKDHLQYQRIYYPKLLLDYRDMVLEQIHLAYLNKISYYRTYAVCNHRNNMLSVIQLRLRPYHNYFSNLSVFVDNSKDQCNDLLRIITGIEVPFQVTGSSMHSKSFIYPRCFCYFYWFIWINIRYF